MRGSVLHEIWPTVQNPFRYSAFYFNIKVFYVQKMQHDEMKGMHNSEHDSCMWFN